MLPQNVVDARNAATEYTKQAGTTAAAEPLVADVLRQKITEAYASSQDIVKPLDTATAKYLGAPAEARVKYEGIFNPFQRENLVSQYQSNESLPMLSLSSILGQRFGRIEDTIGAGTNAFRSQVLADQAKTEQANNLYRLLMDEYTTTESIKSQQQADDLAKRKFEYEMSKEVNDGKWNLGDWIKSTGQGNGWQSTPQTQQDEWEVVDIKPQVQTWEDPLRKMQQEQERSKMIGGIQGVNLSGIGGLNNNVR